MTSSVMAMVQSEVAASLADKQIDKSIVSQVTEELRTNYHDLPALLPSPGSEAAGPVVDISRGVFHYQFNCTMPKRKLENVAIIAMYCHLRPPDVIAFPT